MEQQTAFAPEGQKWVIQGVTCDGLDMRFEDWKAGKNIQREPLSECPTHIPKDGSKWVMAQSMPFSIPIDTGEYLNVIYTSNAHKGFDPFTSYNRPKLKVVGEMADPMSSVFMKPQDITITTTELAPRADQANKNWFYFVVLYLGNECVKAPEYPRTNGEKMAASKERTNLTQSKWRPSNFEINLPPEKVGS